jgi:hypothetical protein
VPSLRLRYHPYDELGDTPNVIVDGSAAASTVLTLSHWPGIVCAHDGLADDLSAQMAFRYVDRGMDLHGDAEVVTNNHFDQDGLVGVYALVAPDDALAARALLEDVAAAGDFGTYRDRRAARIAAVISATGMLTAGDPYPVGLEHLPQMLKDVDTYRDLWIDDDERLSASERARDEGRIAIDELPELDLPVVTVDPSVARTWGNRFTGRRFDGVHPMAIHNATDMSTIALVHGHRFQLTHRYETWVQYQSRPRRPRVALLPLAREFTELDTVKWRADAVGDLTPTLSHEGGSSLPPDAFVERVVAYLRAAPPAWDPAVGRPGS